MFKSFFNNIKTQYNLASSAFKPLVLITSICLTVLFLGVVLPALYALDTILSFVFIAITFVIVFCLLIIQTNALCKIIKDMLK